MLDGGHGRAAMKAMQIVTTLGEIFGAERLVEIESAQVAGVSYSNLGDAGLALLEDLARDGSVRAPAALNPAGMDLADWEALEIDDRFADRQLKVIDAYRKMGIHAACTCVPYLAQEAPAAGSHLAWSESSAVCYANSVLGAMTNREGGPGALAAAITGRTAFYGLHLPEARNAQVHVEVRAITQTPYDLSILGSVVGRKAGNRIPLVTGLETMTTAMAKAFCASVATFGGVSLYHTESSPRENREIPAERIVIEGDEFDDAATAMGGRIDADLVNIGCPHLGLDEIREVARYLDGKHTTRALWITTARTIKEAAVREGLADVIEASGARLVCDTCVVVSPIGQRYRSLATDSAKAWYYATGTNRMTVSVLPREACLELAVRATP